MSPPDQILEVVLDARSVRPADLLTGWVRVGGADGAAVDEVLVGLFGRDADGGVYGDTFVARVGAVDRAGGRGSRVALPVPPEAAPAATEDATCLMLCRVATAGGEIAAERVEPIEVQPPGAAREAALRMYAEALGWVHERPPQALAAIETAAAALPVYAPVHALRGDLIWEVRRDEAAARAAWEAARHAHPMKLDTGFPDYRLALHAAAAGQWTRARGRLEAALAAAPANGEYHEAIAALHVRAGAFDLAERALLAALALRESPGALRGLLNLYESQERPDELLALGDRFLRALSHSTDAPPGRADASAAEALRAHCEYFYVLAKAAHAQGWRGAARRWLARYFDTFAPGERARGDFAGSPFAQHGSESWFVEVALELGRRAEEDPYLMSKRAAEPAPASAPAVPGEALPDAPGFRVLPSGIVLGPRYFEPRDPAALIARWGALARSGESAPEPPALSRRGAAHWDGPIFDPALRKKEGA